jgi:hypothetical protein
MLALHRLDLLPNHNLFFFRLLSSAQKSVASHAKLKLGSEKKHDGGGGVDLYGGYFKAQGVTSIMYRPEIINFEYMKSKIYLCPTAK